MMTAFKGLSQPVPDATRVRVRFATGDEDTCLAGEVSWLRTGSGGDIVAYEVLSEPVPVTAPPFDGVEEAQMAARGLTFPNHPVVPVVDANFDESAKRKAQPIVRGVLDYFPDALLAVSELSRIANEKHNPGQPMHWSKGKSNDHADCCVRHLMERGKWDTTMQEPVRHSTAAAWRALANLQTEIEEERERTAA